MSFQLLSVCCRLRQAVNGSGDLADPMGDRVVSFLFLSSHIEDDPAQALYMYLYLHYRLPLRLKPAQRLLSRPTQKSPTHCFYSIVNIHGAL